MASSIAVEEGKPHPPQYSGALTDQGSSFGSALGGGMPNLCSINAWPNGENLKTEESELDP